MLAFKDVGPKLGIFDTIVMMCNNFGLFGSAPAHGVCSAASLGSRTTTHGSSPGAEPLQY